MAASGTSLGAVYALVRDGRARSRSDLARATGLAPSTITLRVEELLRRGLVEEDEPGASRGGRRPRLLRIAADGRTIAGVELGGRHATVVLEELGGRPLAQRTIGIDVTRAPETVLRTVDRAISALATEVGAPEHVAAYGVAVPGPVSVPDRRMVSPSRMPGWSGVDPASILSRVTGVPVVCENDANAMALGEHIAHGRRVQDLVLVKAGSSIGMGIIAGGVLHRGARGVAGDVSHTPVAGGPPSLCSCGRLGCLDVVAGGRVMVAALRGTGVEVSDTPHLVTLSQDGEETATRLLRESGVRVGAVLATVIGFFNPERVVLGGALGASDAFLAAVRATVYDRCLPLSTSGLEVSAASLGPDAGARGAAALAREHLLDPIAIDGRT